MMKEIWKRNSALLKLTGLIGILLFAFWVGMEPHWDYKYPLHVDEWHAMGYTDATLMEGDLGYPNPYGSGEIYNHQEFGFHLFLGLIRTVAGISWFELYRIAPGIIVSLLSFLVYVLGCSKGYGWAAALFVPLIPTSVRTVGPEFLVPVSVTLLLLTVALLVLQGMKSRGMGESLWILLVILGGTIFIHPPTEVVLTILVALYLATYVIQALASRSYEVAGKLVFAIMIRMAVPLVIMWVWVPSIAKIVADQALSQNPGSGLTGYFGFHSGFFEAFGLGAVVLFIIGLFLYTWDRVYSLQTYVLPVCAVFLLIFVNILYPHYDLGVAAVYERSWLYLGLLMAIMAGYSVAYYFRVADAYFKKTARRVATSSVNTVHLVFIILGIVMVSNVLMTGLINQKREDYAQYYHLVGQQIDTDFQWLDKNSTLGDRTILMELSLAYAYPVIAGLGNKVTDASAYPYKTAFSDPINTVLATGSVDTDWLRENKVGVLYTRLPWSEIAIDIANKDLVKVRQGTYIVPPN